MGRKGGWGLRAEVGWAYRDGIAGADVASIGNVCDEVTPLSQRLEGSTCPVAVLTNLRPQNKESSISGEGKFSSGIHHMYALHVVQRLVI